MQTRRPQALVESHWAASEQHLLVRQEDHPRPRHGQKHGRRPAGVEDQLHLERPAQLQQRGHGLRLAQRRAPQCARTQLLFELQH